MMPAMPRTITAAMDEQVAEALTELKDKRDPKDLAPRHKRSLVAAHYTHGLSDAREVHNVYATTLKPWFPGIKEVPKEVPAENA